MNKVVLLPVCVIRSRQRELDSQAGKLWNLLKFTEYFQLSQFVTRVVKLKTQIKISTFSTGPT